MTDQPIPRVPGPREAAFRDAADAAEIYDTGPQAAAALRVMAELNATPRAPERKPWHRRSGSECYECHQAWPCAYAYHVAPEPTTPDDIQEQIEHAIYDGAEGVAPDERATVLAAVMDVLRRRGMVP